MKIKSILMAIFLAVAFLGFGSGAKAQTVDNSALIAQLKTQIAQLQEQIKVLLAQQNPVTKKVVDYINSNGLSASPATLVSSEEVDGLVKVTLKIGTTQFDSYATKDGKFLFPQMFDMTVVNKPVAVQNPQPQTPQVDTSSIIKTSSPMLEAYVVSRCPYGLQMQRAMADAVQKIPELAQYLKVRYIGSVSAQGNTVISMHGDAEAQENLRQICIREEQPGKYWDYISCQMKASGTETSCENSTDIDSAKLSACTSDSARGVAYAQKDFVLDKKYNIEGSPTLVLNGTELSETSIDNRSSEGVKLMVCSGFDSKPSFCNQKLNKLVATTSFSLTYEGASNSSNSTVGGCGTTN